MLSSRKYPLRSGAVAPVALVHHDSLPSQGNLQTPLPNGQGITNDANLVNENTGKYFALPNRLTFSANLEIEACGLKLAQRFQPSRTRHLTSILAATAAATQRSGGALPGFIPKGVCPSTSLQIASHIDPFDRVLRASLHVRSRNTLRRVSQKAGIVKTHIRKVLRHLLKHSAKLEPSRVMPNARLPVNSPARSLGIPPMSFLARSLDSPDHRLPSDLVHGMDIIGSIPASNALTSREVKHPTDANCIKQGLVRMNLATFRNVFTGT